MSDLESYQSINFFKDIIEKKSFVIIVWSPQMAISLYQVQRLKNQNFKVPVIYLMDQNSSLKEGSSFIKKEKIPESYLTKWNYVGKLPASIEHYPSALFVKEGEIIKYLPGFSEPAILSKQIGELL